MIRKKIEEITAQILKEQKITELPIPIRKIAERQGLKIHVYDLGENISGVLVLENGEGVVGINPNEPPVRQRFTIAHEFGHFVLHGNQKESLFVDKEFKVLFRNANSKSVEEKKEQDANGFAASILMPANILKQKIEEFSLDLTDEEAIKKLAQIFEVSTIAMTYRIANLMPF